MKKLTKFRAYLNRLPWQLPLSFMFSIIGLTVSHNTARLFSGIVWGLNICIYVECFKDVFGTRKKFKAEIENIHRTGRVIEAVIASPAARRHWEKHVAGAPWN